MRDNHIECLQKKVFSNILKRNKSNDIVPKPIDYNEDDNKEINIKCSNERETDKYPNKEGKFSTMMETNDYNPEVTNEGLYNKKDRIIEAHEDSKEQ